MKEVMNCYTEIEMNERKGKWMKRKGNIKNKKLYGLIYELRILLNERSNVWMKEFMNEWKRREREKTVEVNKKEGK